MNDPRTVRAASRLPVWMGSIRVRLALLYSTILVGLAVVVVAVIYIGLARSLSEQPVSRQVKQQLTLPSGDVVVVEGKQVDPYLLVEKEANQRALDTLRELALGALFMLFVASIGVGWSVSGRVLRPIGRITDVARDIQATDLSRRINLEGPDDELKQLADTFDGMLGRIDDAFESQRQFIHEASHELRNPLAVIRTNIDVTLADPDASPEDLRHTAEVVQKSTDRMSRLVDDLLVYARKGSLSLERERVDAADVVAEATDEFHRVGRREEHPSRMRDGTRPVGRRRSTRAAPGSGESARERVACQPGELERTGERRPKSGMDMARCRRRGPGHRDR